MQFHTLEFKTTLNQNMTKFETTVREPDPPPFRKTTGGIIVRPTSSSTTRLPAKSYG